MIGYVAKPRVLLYCFDGPLGRIYGKAVPPRYDSESSDVICMLMGDKDTVRADTAKSSMRPIVKKSLFIKRPKMPFPKSKGKSLRLKN